MLLQVAEDVDEEWVEAKLLQELANPKLDSEHGNHEDMEAVVKDDERIVAPITA